MDIQSVLFDRSKFDARMAMSFLRKMNLKPIKRVHKTKTYYRYRISNPNNKSKYVTKKLTDGVMIVLKN
jgi:hypothetical protein